MAEHVPEKVLRYEEFLNEKLRSGLRAAMARKVQISSQMSGFVQLQRTLSMLQEKHLTQEPLAPLKTRVDLGCNIYARAVVEDPRRIFVSIGLGFFLEMDLQEAQAFSEKRLKELQSRVDMEDTRIAGIKGHIQLFLQALGELQTLPTSAKQHASSSSQNQPHRVPW